MSFEYYGYPRDWLQRFQDGIAKVTKVSRAGCQTKTAPRSIRHPRPRKEKTSRKPLNSLGKVTPWTSPSARKGQ